MLSLLFFIYYTSTISFQIRNKVPNDPAWKGITRQRSYCLWQLMQWWPSAHILFQFRLKLRTYITLSVLKKYVQILGNTMKMALYACKAKFWKKTHLTKENNPDFKLPLLNFIEFDTLCINLEICKNEL